MSNHLIEVKNVYKIYNPGENEVRATGWHQCHH